MKKFSLVTVFMLLLIPVLTFAQSADKPVTIAAIDISRVFAESETGKASNKKVNDFLQGKQQEWQAEANKLQSDITQFNTQRATLNAEALTTRENELQRRQLEVEQKRKDIQRQFNQIRYEELSKFQKVLAPIVKKLAEDRKYTLIIEISPAQGNPFLHVDKTIDITDEVIGLVNSSAPAN